MTIVAMSAKKTLALLLSIVTIVLLPLAYSDGIEGEKTKWILASYFDGPLKLDTEESELQWQGTYEAEIEWTEERHIEVFTVNNGTHVYFLLVWKDGTGPSSLGGDAGDGVAIIFEKAGKDGSDDVWYWSTKTVPELASNGILNIGEWTDGEWSVVIGRRLSQENGATLNVGEAREDLVKIGVWDGAKGESFETVEKEETEHYNFVALPYIDTQPKDVFVWSGILIAGAVVFGALEVRRHKRSDKA